MSLSQRARWLRQPRVSSVRWLRSVLVRTDRIIARHPEALEAEVDGQRVLMSPKGFTYFGLVNTGALVWDRLTGEATVDELVSALASEFATDEAVVRRDVVEFVSALEAAGLLADS